MLERLKKYPEFAAATIAVMVAAGSASVWITEYFARQSFVAYIKCYSDETDNSLSAQIKSVQLYAAYRGAKEQVLLLEEKAEAVPGNRTISADIEEAIKVREAFWDDKERAVQAAEDAETRKDKCEEELV